MHATTSPPAAAPLRRAPARLAPAPPPEPARPRARGRDLDPPPELRRDRPRRAQPRDGAAPGRAARRAAARAQRAAGRGRLRAGLPRAPAGRPRAGRGARARSTWCSRATSRIPRWPSTGTGTWSPPTRVVPLLLAGADADAAAPPVNVLRLSLHPRRPGAAHRQPGEWRAHLLRPAARSRSPPPATPCWRRCSPNCAAYPAPRADDAPAATATGSSCRSSSRTPPGVLSFISTTTVFGTPVDMTLRSWRWSRSFRPTRRPRLRCPP